MQLLCCGRHISYDILGDSGDPVLFIHGWGGTKKSLLALAGFASEKNRSILIDLPGFGESDNPDPDWGVEEYAGVIEEFLQHLRIRQVTYFGHSFGGSLGIYLAAHKPHLIRKLILCNSSYKRVQQYPYGKRMRILMKWVPWSLIQIARRVYYKILHPRSDMMRYPSLELNFRKILTQDLTHLVSKIKAPTLLIWSEKDLDTPLELGQELHEKIASSRLITAPNATHGLPISHPEEVFSLIKSFL